MRSILLLGLLSVLGCGGELVIGGPAGPGGTDPASDATSGPQDPTAPQDPVGPPFPKSEACYQQTQVALRSRPVDIIMVIDNSGSMSSEIKAVEKNINSSFAAILEQSGVDYRVILIAAHGSSSSVKVCIQAPLSGTDCNPVPSAPVNGERFFHYDTSISSTNSLRKVLDTYGVTDVRGFAPGGWSGWLRPGSFRTFIEITDDESAISADTFETGLFALDPDAGFGDASSRNYIFHSIIGIPPNTPATEAWPPSAPVKNARCSTAARAGVQYELLSIRTGGLRFPVCETDSYDAVFEAAAADVIAHAQVSCEFTPPPPPEGWSYGHSYIEYVSGTDGAIEYLLPVGPSASCTESTFEVDAESRKITLCPEACARVKADEGAEVTVAYACGPVFN
jgi:hypothetical protein